MADESGRETLTGALERAPRCVECDRQWADGSERWRSFLTVDNETAVYCPACAEREFGSS